MIHRAKISLSIVSSVAMLWGCIAPAHADSTMRMQLSADVPITCSAELSASLEGDAAGSYSLGYVRKFCNTAFQLALNHGEASAGARLSYKGREVDARGSRTVLEPQAAPTSGGMDEIRLVGATMEGARQFSSDLFVTITPTGI